MATLCSGGLALSMLCLLGCAEPELRLDSARYPHAFDLAAHVEVAAIRAETRVIDFGTPASHDFQVAGWTGDDVFADDGSTFAWSLGAGSTVRLTVLEPRDLEVEARLRPYRIDGPPQKVAIALNGHPVHELTLGGGMREYRFMLPADAIERGLNELRFDNVYPEDIGPGPPDLGPPGTAWDYLRIAGGEPVAAVEARDGDLFLPFGSELGLVVEAAASAFVVEAIRSSHRRGELEIRTRREGERQDVEHRLAASRRPVGVEIGGVEIGGGALGGGEPALVHVALTATGGRGSGGLLLRRPRLRSAVEITTERRALTRSEPAPPPPPATPRRQNVLIYLVDTLRADHLGCYGYERATSPRLDAFAADAVVFDQAVAQSSWTRSSVASLFTGRRPPSHGVHGRDHALADDAVTLAELLRDAGYATAAFVTNGNASRAFGFAQGFDVFELLGQDKTSTALHAPADEVHRAAARWLDRHGRQHAGRPFFLYLHTMEPHSPYAPPPAALRGLGVEPSTPEIPSTVSLGALREHVERSFGVTSRLELGSVAWLQALQRGALPADAEMTRGLTDLYDAEVFFNDRHFGALVDDLRRRGLAESTVIVFVSDHGEELHDHGGWEHGKTLYQEQIRVPLVARFPDADLPRGARLPGPARQIDVLPTLADYLGLPVPAGVEGASLMPEIRGRRGAPRPAYSHLRLDGHFAESLVEGRFKVICDGSRGESCRLFDLVEDPGERHDLAARRPVRTAYLEQRMRAVRGTARGLPAPTVEADGRLREQLRALGYL